jgi:hypothetical protein
VLTIFLESRVAPFTWVPLISPSCSGKQMFINHPQVSSYLRQQHALFYCLQTDIVQLSDASKDEYFARVETLAALHASKTLSTLALGLPCYRCKFQKQLSDTSSEHPFVIMAEGRIGDD